MRIKNVYIGTCKIRGQAIIDWLLVWWWGAWGRAYCRAWGGWGAWWVVYRNNYIISQNTCVIIWAGGVWCGTNPYWWSWGDSCFWNIVAYWWWWGGWGCCSSCTNWLSWWSWWWASWWGFCYWWSSKGWQWQKWGIGTTSAWAWWGGYSHCWMDWCYCSYTSAAYGWGGVGWCGYCSDISWTAVRYANGWSWWGCKSTPWMCGGGAWGCYTSACACWKNATTPWSWGGGAWNNAYKCPWWNGANGIFIARYPTACWYNITWGCKYTCGDYTIHCFTSNWTLEIH